MSFHNYNSVEDFDLPSEVKEEAEDLDDIIEEGLEEAEEGGELPATATNTPMMTLGGLVLALTAGALLIVRRRFQNV
nr:LPXTG cell wall anchor domain-containing protein [Alteribacter salitolerans]